MPLITYNMFKGSIPRVAEHLVPQGNATKALDCRLDDGTLDCWYEPLEVAQAPAGTVTSYLLDCCWLHWPTCVDVAESGSLCRELVTTGDKPWPAIGTLDKETCTVSWSRLGVPCAVAAPSVVAPDHTDNKDLQSISFAYQYVNARGAKGALSRASEPVLHNDGASVVISAWSVPDSSWGVTHVNIYAYISGLETGKEAANSMDTVPMFVGVAPIGASSFMFNAFAEDLINALEEDVVEPPPAELRGVCRVASMNCFAGFVGDKIYFSENNNPDNWPYYMTLEDNIRGIAESNSIVYVATDGAPVAIVGESDCKNAGCRSVSVLGEPYPMMGFGSRRMVSLTNGVGYPSKDGFVVLSGRSPPTVITWPLYSPSDWHNLIPESVVPVYSQGFLYVFGARNSFCLGLREGGKNGWDADNHTELSDRVTDAFSGRDGEVYLLKNDKVYRWNASGIRRPHTWVSADFVTGVPQSYKGGYIHHTKGVERVKISMDLRVVEDRDVISARPFTLPTWAYGIRTRIELRGTAKVSLIALGSALEELRA